MVPKSTSLARNKSVLRVPFFSKLNSSVGLIEMSLTGSMRIYVTAKHLPNCGSHDSCLRLALSPPIKFQTSTRSWALSARSKISPFNLKILEKVLIRRNSIVLVEMIYYLEINQPNLTIFQINIHFLDDFVQQAEGRYNRLSFLAVVVVFKWLICDRDWEFRVRGSVRTTWIARGARCVRCTGSGFVGLLTSTTSQDFSNLIIHMI